MHNMRDLQTGPQAPKAHRMGQDTKMRASLLLVLAGNAHHHWLQQSKDELPTDSSERNHPPGYFSTGSLVCQRLVESRDKS